MATKKARAARKKSGAVRKRAARPKTAKKAAPKKTVPRKPAAKSARRASTKRVPAKAARKTAAGRTKVARDANASRKAASVRRVEAARRTAEPPAVDTSMFPCGDEAVRNATGKTWSEWLSLLDASGAAKKALDHRRIWDLVMQGLPEAAGWWGQMVAVGYERARGLRERHESCAGDFQSTFSRTLPVPLFAAFAAWADDTLRRQWLDAPDLDFTKLNAGKNIRARWPDGSRLDIRFNASGPDKCQIVVDTMKLPDAEAVQRAKAFWQEQLERLRAYLRV